MAFNHRPLILLILRDLYYSLEPRAGPPRVAHKPVRATRSSYVGPAPRHQAISPFQLIHLECPSTHVRLEPKLWRVALERFGSWSSAGLGVHVHRQHPIPHMSAKAIRLTEELASGCAPSENMTNIAGSTMVGNRLPPDRSNPSMFHAMEMKLRFQSGVQCHQPVRKCSGHGAGWKARGSLQ